MSISQPILLWSIETKQNETKWGQENTKKLEKHHHSPSYGILQASFSNIKPHKSFIHFMKPNIFSKLINHVFLYNTSSPNCLQWTLMAYITSKEEESSLEHLEAYWPKTNILTCPWGHIRSKAQNIFQNIFSRIK